MSTKYKRSEDIPNHILAYRLNELSDACVASMNNDKAKFDREFTFRIPCELDRDADVVLAEAARRLEFLEEQI